jgi:hypothetical protein
MSIAREHPLRQMFDELIRRRFFGEAQVYDSDIAEYVSGIVTEFAHVDTMYRIRNARGEQLTGVAEMLIESNPHLDAPSFDREREVRKHVGDFTLFFTGLFPEAVAKLPTLRTFSCDKFVDYMRAGKESYNVVAAFNLCEYADEAPLFRRMSDRFEECVFGLNLVKQDLAKKQANPFGELRDGYGLWG